MRTLLNDNWQFLKLPPGSTAGQAAAGPWQEVVLPHDWLIGQEDLYESADAWYRRILVREAGGAPVCMLRFDGVYMDCEVLLNGEIICTHAYGYTAFDADLTGKLREGENEILVHIRHQSPNSRWYSGSGIYRDVWLEELPENHLVRDGFSFQYKQQDGQWLLRVKAEASREEPLPFRCVLKDAEGRVAAQGETDGSGKALQAELVIRDVRLWSPESPSLYTLEMTYGAQTEIRKTGIRWTAFDPDRGFFLNGKNIKLKGVCLHHDLGCLGAAFHEKAARRQLQLMLDMGANAIRTSHNPPAEKWLDLCDEMGILVVDEAFDMWEISKTTYDYARFFDDCEEEDVARWVRRDRIHPCVIMWSVGNEIYDMHAGERGAEITQMLKDQVERHDPARHARVTFGCNYMPWEGGQRCAEIVKVPGYNYGEKLYEAHHRAHPDWVIYGSETASVLSSRGIYHFPMEKSIMSDSDLQCSALGNSNTSWGASDLREIIVNDLNTPYSMGQFIWSGIDYIGEPTPYHTRSCYFGQADTACFPKDAYYLFQSLWTDRPMLHIGVIWDWNPGQMIDVPVMSNCSRVELYLNGRRIGAEDVDRNDPERCRPAWKVPFEAGELRAVGYDPDGNAVCTDSRYTPGESAALRLTAEQETLRGNGTDLAFITVAAEDSDGRPVENARDRVTLYVDGGGTLLGTDNGDSTDPDSYKSPERHLFGGKLLAVVRSDGSGEDVVIRAESAGKEPARLVIPVTGGKGKTGPARKEAARTADRDQIIPVRKVEILPVTDTTLTPEQPECRFRWRVCPPDAVYTPIQWQVTNPSGIETPYAELTVTENEVAVRANGDGAFCLRALTGNQPDHPEIISMMEIIAEGLGNPALNPYQFVSAGLYDLHEGEIGAGNEKGIAFARDEESMIGFKNVDFGRTGSDCLTLPIFTLDSKPYEIPVYTAGRGEALRLLTTLHYQKPSIWNTYQEETYRLPERLTGIRTLCFASDRKFHLKGFVFREESRAWSYQTAAGADDIYGDSFTVEGSAVNGIGNNVTLVYRELDFGENKAADLVIEGRTELPVNAVTIRMRNENGDTVTEIADFEGGKGEKQQFRITVPSGRSEVAFVFLPGSRFDFYGFRFQQP